MFSFTEKFLFVVGCIIAAFLIVALAKDDIRKKREFMEECLAEKKKYECVALWRGGR